MPKAETPHARSARRAGWVLLLAAAAASSASRVDPARFTTTTLDSGRVRLEYSRIGQAGAPVRLRVWVAAGLGGEGGLRVRLSQAYTRLMRIDRVLPRPVDVRSDGSDVVFSFRAPANAPSLIEFDLLSPDYGRRDGRLAVAAEQPLEFTQYVVP